MAIGGKDLSNSTSRHSDLERQISQELIPLLVFLGVDDELDAGMIAIAVSEEEHVLALLGSVLRCQWRTRWSGGSLSGQNRLSW
jgi:hypothetical protein